MRKSWRIILFSAPTVVVPVAVGYWFRGWLGAGIGAGVGAVAAALMTDLTFGIFEVEGPFSRFVGVVVDAVMSRALAGQEAPGRLAFSPPNRMQLGETERVEVRLARGFELHAELVGQVDGQGGPRLAEISTASRMAVTLAGDGFNIKCHSEEEQAVSHDGITVWEFDIRAVRRGQQRLFLSVSLRIPVPGQPLVSKSIAVREAEVYVQMGIPALIGQFVSSYWQWLVGTAIAAAAVVVTVIFH